MSRKLFAVLAVLAISMAIPALAAAQQNRATLTDVHVISALRAKPVGTANCTNAPANALTGPYAFTGWRVQATKTALLNTATIPSGLGTNAAVVSALQASFDAWKGAETAAPKITVAGGGTITKQTANHQYDLLFGRAGGSSIAVTYTWTWSNGEIESDTVFNSSFAWFMAGTEGDGCVEGPAWYDLRNIATHEFGHTYGLTHPDARWETMFAYGYSGETAKWSLGPGDTAGIRARYP